MAKSTFQLSDGTSVSTGKPEELEPDAFSAKAFVNELREELATNKLALPTLPNLAVEALFIINDIDSSVDDLVKVIHKDTSITARLIRYANSALFRGVDPVSTIKPAVTRIGFAQVKNAIYAVSMKEVFSTAFKPIEKRMHALWTHSVNIGAHAATLAKQNPGLDPNMALVGGLIHDIGKIPLLVKACEHKELCENSKYLDMLLIKLHPKLGSNVLKAWKFDPRLVAVAAEHESIGRNPGNAPVDYVDLIQVANIMSYEDTDHPLAKIDRSKVKSFARIKTGGNEASGAKENSQEIGEIFF